MAWIETIEEDAATSDLKTRYDAIRDPTSGQVDNIMRIHSLHPAGLDGHFALYTAVMRGTDTLPRVDREMIAVVVSRINDCHY
jgi:alkylhydroperoxidase family enzyme